MDQSQAHETSRTIPTDRTDGTETQSPATNAYTPTPGQALPKDGMAGWGVGARWFLIALLAIGFIVCLYVFFPR
jgi:hypothetical protein